MKRHFGRRWLSPLLVAALLGSAFPFAAFAEGRHVASTKGPAQMKPAQPAPVPEAERANYPRVVQRGGQTCLQQLSNKFEVSEDCYVTSVPTQAASVPAAPSLAPSAVQLAARFDPKEAAAKLGSATARYSWALPFKFVAVPTILGGAAGLGLAATTTPSAARTPYLVASSLSLAVGLLSGLVAWRLDEAASDDLVEAARLK